ncbi:MAG: WD40/YVTN/BNR-like repeat-containing protein [Acidimicrobiales bacterium]
MLLVGTKRHLEDLDRQFTIAEDVCVTAIAPELGTGAGGPHVLLDGARIARVDEYELAPIARVEEGGGQSMAAVNGGLLVGLEDARLAMLDLAGGGLTHVGSFDSVPGRATWDNPVAQSPDLRSLCVTEAGSWLVNVHVGGVWRSADRGATWTNVISPGDDVHEVVNGATGLVVAAARGFGWSLDDGATWQWTTEGLHAAYCRAAAVDGDLPYVTASTGPSTRDGRLYRAAGLGGGFEPCGGGLPDSFPFNLDTGCLAARDGEVALGTPDGQVWRSRDRGNVFQAVTERVGRVQVLRFA